MKIMLVGSGGREHAILKRIKENPKADEIYILSGNGGMAGDGTCIDISPTDIEGICNFATKNSIDFAIVSPDDPLVMGLVDKLEEKGIKTFGPRKNAAIIEGSKSFAKKLMQKYGIPTASYEIFTDYENAAEYISKQNFPLVIKADGLALGKGVIICNSKEEALEAASEMLVGGRFGESGREIVIEEFLEGTEVSLLAFTDGKTIVPMVSSMDHKRAFDGDQGPNTGGMGTIAPNPYYTEDAAREVEEKILLPTIAAMNNEGRTFKGCLYFGLMLTKEGSKVIEYNCRFGDPEAQVVIPLLESDLLEIMLATAEERLSDMTIKFSSKQACCVVCAAEGYPVKYEKGKEINFDGKIGNLFVAGARLENGKLYTNGGRVLGVTALGESLDEAISKAYSLAKRVHFDGKFMRSDIGKRGLKWYSESM